MKELPIWPDEDRFFYIYYMAIIRLNKSLAGRSGINIRKYACLDENYMANGTSEVPLLNQLYSC